VPIALNTTRPQHFLTPSGSATSYGVSAQPYWLLGWALNIHSVAIGEIAPTAEKGMVCVKYVLLTWHETSL
jgi:hypothetical protein